MVARPHALSLCAFAVLLTGQAPPPAIDATQDFCTRLGAAIGQEKIEGTDGRSSWTSNALNFGQRVLFGGSATTTVAVEPIEPATIDDYRRANDICLNEDGGAVCRIVGPMNFEFTWKGAKSVTPIREGEKAVVKVKSTRAWCWSGVSDPVD